MSYPPKHHQEGNREHLIEVIKAFPLGLVISVENNIPSTTHIPLIFNEGKLIGHIDKNNPQTKLLRNNNNVTIVFSGPDCYISPSLFKSDELPTWNYIKVHIQGKVTEISDISELKQSMVAMTKTFESPVNKFKLSMENPKMEQYINYVYGFEVEITSWEGKFKLSQDKSPEQRAIANQEMKTIIQSSINILDNLF